MGRESNEVDPENRTVEWDVGPVAVQEVGEMTRTRRRFGAALKEKMALAALLAAGCAVVGCQEAAERSDYQPRVAQAVSSRELAATEIVPTLDTPLAEHGNAVWCATFQVAWNRARDDMIGGALRIANAQHVADRLNNSSVTEAALPPDSYYAVAGRIEDGIVETIQGEMARRFPGAQPPDFADAVGFVTYAYLDTKATFTTPFVDTRQPIQFSDADGVMHCVSGFGLHEGTDWGLRAEQAAQVKVLFSEVGDPTDDESNGADRSGFALDLTADHPARQVIVAVLPRAKHLRAALDDLARRIDRLAPDEYSERLREIDTLAIPNVAFHVNHEFTELQGTDKVIENAGEFQGLFILKAAQSILFRLDKSGATVISESNMSPGAIPRCFVVDRPFLIVMKRRSTDEPYFVAWIENAHLLAVSQADAGSGS